MKKLMKVLMALTVMTYIVSSGIGTQAYAKERNLTPKIQIVTQPNSEYTPADTISFTVWNPTYPLKVEYRVILYNGTTKKTTNLWNTPSTGYYYRGWQPAGTYKFQVHWSAKQLEPGPYSMTVLVRRANTNISYDSYVDTKSFWIREDGTTESGSSGSTGNTSSIEPKFIPNASTRRVTIIDDRMTKPFILDMLKSQKEGKTVKQYFGSPIFVSEKYGTSGSIDTNIRYYANMEQMPTLTYDGKDYAIFEADDLDMYRYVNERLDSMKNYGMFDGNDHNFEVYFYEVFYDNKENKYFAANEVKDVVVRGTSQYKSHNKGDVPKYLAVVVQAADY